MSLQVKPLKPEPNPCAQGLRNEGLLRRHDHAVPGTRRVLGWSQSPIPFNYHVYPGQKSDT